ncbi:DUF7832 domain-containing protein [Paenibacillus mendelii]|uniref:DUF7832 domain-containing protein n=1 Tax=Paenibacillus mendelii TaxID=206163 RepID=UPI001E0AD60C|nr:hypothetical protein [Paenibacillus mendelii]
MEGPKDVLFQIAENEIYVYDKAKWYYEGDFPQELDSTQAYIPTGMFLLRSISGTGNAAKAGIPSLNREGILFYMGTEAGYRKTPGGYVLIEKVNDPGIRYPGFTDSTD